MTKKKELKWNFLKKFKRIENHIRPAVCLLIKLILM